MKLFIREHQSLIVLQIGQLVMLVLLLWLSDFTEWSTILYGLILSIFFLICYLLYKYFSRRRFYQILTKRMMSIDESLQPLDQQPVSIALKELLRNQYDQFQGELISLQEKQQEQLIFIDRWVHQMKTPLSVIELMAHDLDEPEASSLREEVDRLKTGLTTALYMARLRNIEQDFNVKRVDLKNVVQEIVADQRRLFIRQGIFPKVQVPAEMFIHTDEKWLHFIVNQLIENGIKYSSGRTEKMEIKVERREGRTVLSITDFGIGIPQEDIRSIFKPFFTGKNGRIYRESTGVGLYLVKEIVTHLGHDVEVFSKVKEGTTFKIYF